MKLKQYLQEEFADYVRVGRKNVAVYKNPSRKELSDIVKDANDGRIIKKYPIRFILDFVNKKVINELIDKKERVIQQIRIAVNVWLGDWFLDEDFGIDYDSSWGSQELMELYIKEQIKQVPGVNKIDSFSIKKISNDTEQYFQIDTVVKFEGEVLEISELIGV